MWLYTFPKRENHLLGGVWALMRYAEPIPSTGRLHSPIRMRCPKTTQELRAIIDPEYGKYIRTRETPFAECLLG